MFLTDLSGNVTIDSEGETLEVQLQETTWQGMGVPRPEDKGVRFLSICEANVTQLPMGLGDAHRRLIEIQIYRLDKNRSEVILRCYSNSASVVSLVDRMIDRIRRAWPRDKRDGGAAAEPGSLFQGEQEPEPGGGASPQMPAGTHQLLPGGARLQRRQAGRNPDPHNEAAYRKFVEGGRTHEAYGAAFDWWCDERNRTPDRRVA